MTSARYRANTKKPILVGLSVSYERDNLLARGLGLEHLKELLFRLGRPLLRQGVNLAYGGHWRDVEDNFTYDLLRLISSEQENQNAASPDDEVQPIGRLFNHVPWPHYQGITPSVEAQWINCCRIVRITQQDAQIAENYIVPDGDSPEQSEDAQINAALTLSAMRRIAMDSWALPIPGRSRPETIPPLAARVILGGKVADYSGWLPGIFEEALVTLERSVPLYLLGGFGGAAEVLAKMLLDPGGIRPPELTEDWHRERNPKLDKLLGMLHDRHLPLGTRTTQPALDALYARLVAGSASLATSLDTGLDEAETREMLMTRDMKGAVQLVYKGLAAKFSFEPLWG